MDTSARTTRPSRTTRAKIVKAASRAFAEHGYDGASIRTIVGQADVNQAAINYHFGSKEELFRAVLQTALCEHALPGGGAAALRSSAAAADDRARQSQ
jgi:AcrR family transcriptional regulator